MYSFRIFRLNFSTSCSLKRKGRTKSVFADPHLTNSTKELDPFSQFMQLIPPDRRYPQRKSRLTVPFWKTRGDNLRVGTKLDDADIVKLFPKGNRDSASSSYRLNLKTKQKENELLKEKYSSKKPAVKSSVKLTYPDFLQFTEHELNEGPFRQDRFSHHRKNWSTDDTTEKVGTKSGGQLDIISPHNRELLQFSEEELNEKTYDVESSWKSYQMKAWEKGHENKTWTDYNDEDDDDDDVIDGSVVRAAESDDELALGYVEENQCEGNLLRHDNESGGAKVVEDWSEEFINEFTSNVDNRKKSVMDKTRDNSTCREKEKYAIEAALKRHKSNYKD